MAAEPATQLRPADGTYRHVIVMAPEVDLVAGFDAQLVAKLLWDHDLALRPDPMSHTVEYNRADAGTETPRRRSAPISFVRGTAALRWRDVLTAGGS